MRYIPGFQFLSLLLLVSVVAAAGCQDLRSTGEIEATAGSSPESAWRIDHAVIVVDNLTASMEKFQDAGFNLVLGGKHADDFTWNALIPFKDGSYLELFAATDPEAPADLGTLLSSGTFDTAMAGLDAMQKRFMLHLATGTGLRDYAITAPGLNLTQAQAMANNGGYILEGPIRMSRTRPDGMIAKWQVAVPVGEYANCVPFLIIDDTPRTLRVPNGHLIAHPNGVTGIMSIEVAAHDPAAVSRWYKTVLSGSPGFTSYSRAMFALNDSAIKVRGITGDESEGIVGLILQTNTGDVVSLENMRTMNALIRDARCIPS